MDVRKTSGRVPEGEVARHDGQAVVTGPDKCVAHLPLMRRIRRAQIAQKYRRRFVGGLPSVHPDSPRRDILPQITVMHGATPTPLHANQPCAGRSPCGPRTTTPSFSTTSGCAPFVDVRYKSHTATTMANGRSVVAA